MYAGSSPVAGAKSWISTMPGWRNAATAWASRLNRSPASSRAATARFITLMATVRPSCRSRARNTVAMAP
jgi:hypothetical protein